MDETYENDLYSDEGSSVSVVRFFQILWAHWLQLVAAFAVFAIAAMLLTLVFIPKTYAASAQLYITSSATATGSGSISQTEMNAAKNLLDVYTIILKSEPVLTQVLENTQTIDTYSVESFSRLISASSVDGTEIMKIKVTTKNPEDCQTLVNALATYGLPQVANKVKAGNATIIQTASSLGKKAGPSLMRNTILGGLIGFLLFAVLFVCLELFNDRIRDVNTDIASIGLPLIGSIDDYSDYLDRKAGKQQ